MFTAEQSFARRVLENKAGGYNDVHSLAEEALVFFRALKDEHRDALREELYGYFCDPTLYDFVPFPTHASDELPIVVRYQHRHQTSPIATSYYLLLLISEPQVIQGPLLVAQCLMGPYRGEAYESLHKAIYANDHYFYALGRFGSEPHSPTLTTPKAIQTIGPDGHWRSLGGCYYDPSVYDSNVKHRWVDADTTKEVALRKNVKLPNEAHAVRYDLDVRGALRNPRARFCDSSHLEIPRKTHPFPSVWSSAEETNATLKIAIRHGVEEVVGDRVEIENVTHAHTFVRLDAPHHRWQSARAVRINKPVKSAEGKRSGAKVRKRKAPEPEPDESPLPQDQEPCALDLVAGWALPSENDPMGAGLLDPAYNDTTFHSGALEFDPSGFYLTELLEANASPVETDVYFSAESLGPSVQRSAINPFDQDTNLHLDISHEELAQGLHSPTQPIIPTHPTVALSSMVDQSRPVLVPVPTAISKFTENFARKTPPEWDVVAQLWAIHVDA